MTSLDWEQKPVSWKSRYGSVNFNLLGIGWAYGEMKEAGIVLSSMAMKEASYPQPDLRPSIHMLSGSRISWSVTYCRAGHPKHWSVSHQGP